MAASSGPKPSHTATEASMTKDGAGATTPDGPRRRERLSARDPLRTVRVARLVALVLVGAGFIVILAGWIAASRVSCVDCQIPYLLSAGATGLGLIVLGVGVLLMGEIRAARAHIVQRMTRSGQTSVAEPHGTPSSRPAGPI
jgi:hypothetical protein